jgi:hypothetical protein
MNLKSKLFGFTAAAALSLSIMTGAMAQSSTQVPAEVTLKGTTCSVSMTEGGSLFYGEWQWNGYQYVRDGNAVSKTLKADVKSGNPSGCILTLKFDGMRSGSNHIPNSAFVGGIPGVGSGVNMGLVPNLSTGFQLPGTFDSGEHSGSLALTDDNNVINTLMPGSYGGPLTIGVVNAQ